MDKHQNQHWISRAFITRFSIGGNRNDFHKFVIDANKWELAGPNNTFCHEGYTQLIEDGKIDHTLEQSFGKVETNLPTMFKALDDLANGGTNALPKNLYDNMCWYFAFLHFLSPFAKALATKMFYEDLHEQLKNGQGDLLVRLTQSQIANCQGEIRKGNKIILGSDTESAAQFLFRRQFERNCLELAKIFRHNTHWVMYRSQINLPISDIALIPLRRDDYEYYSIPLSPNLFISGDFPQALNNYSTATTIECRDMPREMSEEMINCICCSAQMSLISKVKIPDVEARREQAGPRYNFNRVKQPKAIITFGKLDFITGTPLMSVTKATYDKIISQFTEK